MNENHMKDMLESIAQRGVPGDVNLWSRIAESVEKRSFMQTVRARPALALVLVLLALALLSSVAYAIGKVTGYIPGVGIVDQSIPLRVLIEPVITQRDGLTVTVSQVVADSDHTFVAYAIDGIIVQAKTRSMCAVLPSLQLPDGTTLSVVSGGEGPRGARAGSILKFETTVNYSSIPADMSNVTLNFPCILPEGIGPENWQIPLALSPAPKNYATPGVEIGATFVASNPMFIVTPSLTFDEVSTPESVDLSLPPTPTALPNGSGLYLEKVVELPDSYILIGNFADAGDLPGGLEINDDPNADLPYIEDASGNPVAFKVRDDLQPEAGSGGRWARYWAFEIAKPVHGPLTITQDQINIGVSSTAQLDFDAGSNPQTGQKWQLNLPVHLGAYEYVMDSVEVVQGGYLFKYHSGVHVPQGLSLWFNIPGTSPEQNASTVNAQGTKVEYSETMTFSSLPTGPLTVELTLFESVPLKGPWKLTWMPLSK
jgi:hypothetical protein